MEALLSELIWFNKLVGYLVFLLTAFLGFGAWAISRDLREITRLATETLRTVRREG